MRRGLRAMRRGLRAGCTGACANLREGRSFGRGPWPKNWEPCSLHRGANTLHRLPCANRRELRTIFREPRTRCPLPRAAPRLLRPFFREAGCLSRALLATFRPPRGFLPNRLTLFEAGNCGPSRSRLGGVSLLKRAATRPGAGVKFGRHGACGPAAFGL